MMRNTLLAATSFLGTVQAATIGVNFTHDGTNPAAPDDVLFPSTASAGAPGFAQTNWNHVVTDWSGSGGNDALFTAGLSDSTGATTSDLIMVSYPTGHSDQVHFDSNNTWSSASGNATANDTLMNGYLDDGGNDQPYANISLAGGVTSATIVLYIHGDGANGPVGRYWLEEWSDPLVAGTVITDQVGISSNDYTGTYVSAGTFSQTGTPSNVNVPSGNYIVFENITASNIRIRSAGNGDPEDFGRGPLNAFQVITVPEPSSLGLLALAGLSFLRRRRA